MTGARRPTEEAAALKADTVPVRIRPGALTEARIALAEYKGRPGMPRNSH